MFSNHKQNVGYKNIVLTDHAQQRISLRNISLDNIHQTVVNADQTIKLNKNKFKFIKKLDDRSHQIIAKHLTDKQQWLIISVWIRGEEDRKPLVWQLITFPFKAMWKIATFIFNLLQK